MKKDETLVLNKADIKTAELSTEPIDPPFKIKEESMMEKVKRIIEEKRAHVVDEPDKKTVETQCPAIEAKTDKAALKTHEKVKEDQIIVEKRTIKQTKSAIGNSESLVDKTQKNGS